MWRADGWWRWWRADTAGAPRWLIPLATAALAATVAFVLWSPQSHLRLARPAPTVLFIGDSYSSGAGASTKEKRWTTLVSGQEGWVERNAALGGTGYVAESGPAGCGKEYCPPYRAALDAYFDANGAPDVVVVSGGRNDLGKPGVSAAVTEFWDDLCRRSGVSVIVTSPLWHSAKEPASLVELADQIRSESGRCGARYLDLGQPLDRPSLLAEDGVHPNDAGHAAIARAFTAALGSQ